MKFKKNVVTMGGRKFFYWEKNEKIGEIMVLLHGFPANHGGLLDLARCLGEEYHIIMPDLPGCGQSALLPVEHNLKNYVTWLHDFLESISVGDAIIIGHSFGSRIALMFDIYYPKKAKKSVLITPVLKVDGYIAIIASLYYRIAGALPTYFRKALIANEFTKKLADTIVFKSSDNKILQQIIQRDMKELKRVNEKVVIELFNEFYGSSLLPLHKKVMVKSLVIACGRDEIATPSSVKELVDQLSNVSFEVLENEGHFVPSENPKALAKIIKNWLAEPIIAK